MAAGPSELGKLLDVFERNFRERGEIGASVSVWWGGAELLSEGHGWCEREKSRRWTTRTLAPVYSATKVPSAATLLLALDEKGLSPATLVREVWSAFPLAEATFSHLLSHQCGLAALDAQASLFDHASVVAAIEAQPPAWRLGQGHGYHPRTFGALLDEPVRRLTGMTLGGFWREAIADQLKLDFWIGLPEEEWPRVARLYPGKAGKLELEDPFYQAMTTDGTLTRRAFSSPVGLHSVRDMNDPLAWAAGLPAVGGVGTASALGKFYQVLLGAIPGPFSASVRHALATPVSAADDQVLMRPTVFTCGAQRDPLDASGRKIRHLYGPSVAAFGHPGAGGCHAFADPRTGISFGYTMNQMKLGVMPGAKCQEMVDALFSAS
jgi:CubicO group peptidase (beta-lactamase class C family)